MNLKHLIVAVPAALCITGQRDGKRRTDHQRSGRSRLRQRQVGREGSGEGSQAGRRGRALHRHPQ